MRPPTRSWSSPSGLRQRGAARPGPARLGHGGARGGDLADALLAAALDGDAPASRPLARLAARAQALIGLERLEDAEAELRATAPEPVGPSDFPDTLVPRLTRLQGLIAAARGDRAPAERRLREAADGYAATSRPTARAIASWPRWSTWAARRCSGSWSQRASSSGLASWRP